MTEGTSQGLFIVVAIIIFGIFVSLAYILFEDTLSPGLAAVFGDASEESMMKLTKTMISNDIEDFKFDTNTGTILEYVGKSSLVVIPMEIDGVEVTTIAENAILEKKVVTIVVPKTVTNIGDNFATDNDLDLMILPVAIKGKAKQSDILRASSTDDVYYKEGDEVVFSDYSSLTEDVDPNTVVEITDSNLGSKIREELSLLPNEDITVGDMRKLTELDISSSNVNNLDGLEYARNLQNLNVEDNNLTSLEPIRRLKNLTHLNVKDNDIEDFHPIETITFEELIVAGNPITDYNPLLANPSVLQDEAIIKNIRLRNNVRSTLGLTSTDILTIEKMLGLTYIDFDGDTYFDIDDLTGLEYASNLQSINIRNASQGSKLTDLKPISNLPRLKTLSLRLGGTNAGYLADIKPLAKLDKLESLSISQAIISDLSPLKDMKKLKTVSLVKNNISDITPLTNLENLESLNLMNNNSIKNYSPLSNLKKLKTVRVPDTTYATWKKLKGSAAYNSLVLNFASTNLKSTLTSSLGLPRNTDLTPSDLLPLTVISYSGGKYFDIDNLSGLEYAQNLEKITFQLSSNGSDLTDLSQLKELTKLKYLSLNLGGTNKGDLLNLTPLKDLDNLETLSINQSRVSDISPLKNLTNLKSLTITNSSVSNISPLSNLTNLETLNLNNNATTMVYEPLRNLTKLENVSVTNTDYTKWKELVGTAAYNNLSLNFGATNLKSAITTALGVPSSSKVTPLDMLNLKTLSYSGGTYYDIASLSGLEYAHNLEEIVFQLSSQGSDLATLTPLSNLTKLKKLSLSLGGTNKGDLSSIKPLENLTNLEYLSIVQSRVSDIKPLANMEKLNYLRLSNNYVTDYTPIEHLNIETIVK